MLENQLEKIPDNVVIPDRKIFKKLVKKFKEQGKDKIHVLADFDRTLTTAFVNGEKTPSIISILRDGNYLTPDYATKAHEFFDKYHPIEINPDISRVEKKKIMDQWWYDHTELLIKSGLNKRDLDSVINSGKIEFRPGALDFFKMLAKENIPLVIMSASGIGDYCIAGFLENSHSFYNNIYIISNVIEFNKQGKAVKFNEKFIHSLNKDETAIQNFPQVYNKIKKRKNVILLGDNIEDIGMVEGFSYDNLIKVGFLNENIEENLSAYRKNFDIIILNDGKMDFVNQILNKIL